MKNITFNVNCRGVDMNVDEYDEFDVIGDRKRGRPQDRYQMNVCCGQPIKEEVDLISDAEVETDETSVKDGKKQKMDVEAVLGKEVVELKDKIKELNEKIKGYEEKEKKEKKVVEQIHEETFEHKPSVQVLDMNRNTIFQAYTRAKKNLEKSEAENDKLKCKLRRFKKKIKDVSEPTIL